MRDLIPKRESQSLLIFLVVFLVIGSLSPPVLHGQTPKREVATADPMPGASPLSGSYHALVIGNREYRNLPRLQTSLNDANAMAQLLHERYGFVTRVLLNATRNDFFNALAECRRTLSEESSLLIYYAGHSYFDRDRDEAYWFPVDTRPDNREKWISADDITRSVRTIRSKHILIIADSRYSIVLTRDVQAIIDPSERGAYLARMQASKSRTVMTGGSNEPVAEGNGAHSVFANAVMEGLSHMEESEFTGRELFDKYIAQRVANHAYEMRQYSIIRNSGHEYGDFVFSPKAQK
jgi:uncharacterized caspase-like protein